MEDLKENAIYCFHCGERTRIKLCIECSAILERQTANFCSVCGKRQSPTKTTTVQGELKKMLAKKY